MSMFDEIEWRQDDAKKNVFSTLSKSLSMLADSLVVIGHFWDQDSKNVVQNLY